MDTLTFHGPSLNEAIADVRARLGQDAVILSWTRSETGVALTVSTRGTPNTRGKPNPAGGHAGSDGEFDAWNNVARRKSTAPRHDVFAGDAAAVSLPLPEPRGPKPQSPALQSPAPQPAGPQERKTQGRMSGPRKVTAADLIRPAPPAPATASVPRGKPDAAPETAPAQKSPVQGLLLRAGMDPRVLDTLQFSPSETGMRRALIDLFSDRLPFNPLDALPRTPVALVGGPGSGKTVTAAKLAARAMAAGATVTLIGCDTGRSGGIGQLQALAARLGCTFETAGQAAQVREIAETAWAQGNAVILDTPATAGLLHRDIALLARLCEAARAEPVLCLPADMRSDDASDLLPVWATAGARRAIVTRLDLTSRRAGVLGALIGQQGAAIGLSQVSDTPFVAGGLALATPNRLAAALLEHVDQTASTGR
ncbi:MAG: hypothetical protein MUF14_09130 [Hyphomonadaceae bacterium]|jgi:flagellar biosynthesis protein FlhF|nr:hypothetical protein [Hyphomonadaceae bacterium]